MDCMPIAQAEIYNQACRFVAKSTNHCTTKPQQKSKTSDPIPTDETNTYSGLITKKTKDLMTIIS